MATITPLLGTNDVPTNQDISNDNFEALNLAKVESDISAAPMSAVKVNQMLFMLKSDYDAIVAKDVNTVYLTEDGLFIGGTLVANISTPCP